MRHNLDDEKKEHLEKEDNKRKKAKRDKLDDNEKEKMKKGQKKEEKRDNLNLMKKNK